MKIPKKYKLKLIFLARLTALGIIFHIFWNLSPNFYVLKILTAYVVSLITFSKMVVDPSGVFVVKDDFSLLIVTDCTAWKEIFVFLSLFLSWPKEKSSKRAIISILLILLYNILRLSSLVIFSSSFDYFHPFFQILAIFLILFLWLWSISVKKKGKIRKKIKRRRKR